MRGIDSNVTAPTGTSNGILHLLKEKPRWPAQVQFVDSKAAGCQLDPGQRGVLNHQLPRHTKTQQCAPIGMPINFGPRLPAVTDGIQDHHQSAPTPDAALRLRQSQFVIAISIERGIDQTSRQLPDHEGQQEQQSREHPHQQFATALTRMVMSASRR